MIKSAVITMLITLLLTFSGHDLRHAPTWVAPAQPARVVDAASSSRHVKSKRKKSRKTARLMPAPSAAEPVRVIDAVSAASVQESRFSLSTETLSLLEPDLPLVTAPGSAQLLQLSSLPGPLPGKSDVRIPGNEFFPTSGESTGLPGEAAAPTEPNGQGNGLEKDKEPNGQANGLEKDHEPNGLAKGFDLRGLLTEEVEAHFKREAAEVTSAADPRQGPPSMVDGASQGGGGGGGNGQGNGSLNGQGNKNGHWRRRGRH